MHISTISASVIFKVWQKNTNKKQNDVKFTNHQNVASFSILILESLKLLSTPMRYLKNVLSNPITRVDFFYWCSRRITPYFQWYFYQNTLVCMHQASLDQIWILAGVWNHFLTLKIREFCLSQWFLQWQKKSEVNRLLMAKKK